MTIRTKITALGLLCFLSSNAIAQMQSTKACEQLTGEAGIAACTKVIEENRRAAWAYINRGNAWHSIDQYDRAILDYNAAIELNPKGALAFIGRGNSWHMKGVYDQAISDYNRAISINPRIAITFNNRGNSWAAKSNFERAIVDYNYAIQLDPSYANAYNSRGNLWQGRRELEKAASDYDRAIELNPKNAFAYNNRGNIWLSRGDYNRAISDFSSAIALKPDYAIAYVNRGISQKSTGDYAKAISDLERALRLDPSHSNARNELDLIRSGIERRRQAKTLGAASSTGRRIALVIANSNYQVVGTLVNPKRDADLISGTFRKIGFNSVIVKFDLTRQQMYDALREFEKAAGEADWAVIHYAGHAIEVAGVNYMMPIDSKVRSESQISDETINIEHFLNAVETARKLRLVILDACRDNPFIPKVQAASASRSAGSLASSQIGRGLARVEPQPGTLVVFAAKQGQVALDGDGQNSPFAEALVKRIEEKPSVEVRRLFEFVREDVYEMTKRAQQPFAYGSLNPREEFHFQEIKDANRR